MLGNPNQSLQTFSDPLGYHIPLVVITPYASISARA